MSPAEFGLYNEYKEINFTPMLENRISGYGDKFNQSKMNLSLTPKKVQKVVKTCQNLRRSHSILELTRIIGLLSFTIQAVEPATMQLRFLQQPIVFLTKKMNYQSVRTSSTKSRNKLTSWIENVSFCNGRAFSQLNPRMTLQTDVSWTGWGAACNGVQIRAMVREGENVVHKHARTTSNKIGSNFLPQREKS